MTSRTVLVTGAGGAAAVTLIRSLRERYRVVAGDIDPFAVGLYLVEPDDRVLLPRGDDPMFAATLLQTARQHGAHLVIPTVDVELPAVAALRPQFEAAGIRVLVEGVATLDRCLDKWALMSACAPAVRVPATVLLAGGTTENEIRLLGTPFIIKPRRGAGGRGFAVMTDPTQLAPVPRDGSHILQEFLPGEEFSIDVLARPDGHVVATVPRRRDKVDSGIAVAGRTVRDPDLMALGRRVAEAIGVVGVVNVQVRRTVDGTPALLEVNPRFPGTMALTIASGVDMPNLAVDAAFGESVPDHVDFAEIALVRFWDEVVVPIEEYTAVEPVAAQASSRSETSGDLVNETMNSGSSA